MGRLLGITFLSLTFASAAGFAAEPPLAGLARHVGNMVSGISAHAPALDACEFSLDPIANEEANHCRHLKLLVDANHAVGDVFHATPQAELRDRDELRTLLYAYERKIARTGELCYQARFRRCYRNARETISLPELERMFAGFIRDPRLRYGHASGACHLRAEALAFILAEKGIAAKTVRIQRSPTLIAMERDGAGKLSGGYYDYGGFHTLIQVTVEVGGKTVPYLLDPQFMDQPVPREEYFLRTTGQVCVEGSSPEAKSFLNCSFDLLPQNYPSEAIYVTPAARAGKGASACGWTDNPLNEEMAKLFSPASRKGPGLRILNRANTPAELEGKPAGPGTSRRLIELAYESYGEELARQLAMYESQISLLEQGQGVGFFGEEGAKAKLEEFRALKAQLLKDRENLAAKLAEVRRNLAALPATRP